VKCLIYINFTSEFDCGHGPLTMTLVYIVVVRQCMNGSFVTGN